MRHARLLLTLLMVLLVGCEDKPHKQPVATETSTNAAAGAAAASSGSSEGGGRVRAKVPRRRKPGKQASQYHGNQPITRIAYWDRNII